MQNPIVRIIHPTACLLILISGPLIAAPPEVREIPFTDPIPYAQSPIDYHGRRVDEAISRLNDRLESGDVKLTFRKQNGYLRSLLEALDVPVASQVLVFSKTALNPKLVGPRNPRAVYFNDDVYVGWVPGAASLEAAANDAKKGAVFYTLLQEAAERPRLKREGRCLACHAGSTALHVPGYMIRSFVTDTTGKPVSGYSHISHTTAVAKRWGGWYVTGKHGRQTHRGNLIGDKDVQRHKKDPSVGGNIVDLKSYFDIAKYESPHSDIVAHLVLEHQLHGQNLLIRVNQEHQLGRRSDAEDRLLRYLFFVDEAPLAAPVEGTSGFAKQFERRGPADSKRRSLRQFDLKTRLFKYRLSYLVYTNLFDRLPSPVKKRLYGRMWVVLTGKHADPLFRKIPATERTAIVEILRATKVGLPARWRRR